MVDDYVIDTNVWVMMDKPIAEINTAEELECIQACRDWLQKFSTSEDRLVVDILYKILGEYRQNIQQGGLAQRYLNRLEAQPRKRIIDVEIELDEDGYAVVPSALAIPDLNDRKFIAVVLAHEPRPPIIDATDTDWEKDHQRLVDGGIKVYELCPGLIEKRLTEK